MWWRSQSRFDNPSRDSCARSTPKQVQPWFHRETQTKWHRHIIIGLLVTSFKSLTLLLCSFNAVDTSRPLDTTLYCSTGVAFVLLEFGMCEFSLFSFTFLFLFVIQDAKKGWIDFHLTRTLKHFMVGPSMCPARFLLPCYWPTVCTCLRNDSPVVAYTIAHGV